jgi:hypothetical protein
MLSFMGKLWSWDPMTTMSTVTCDGFVCPGGHVRIQPPLARLIE